MTATGIKEKVVAQRVAWIEEMLRGVAELPLDTLFVHFYDEVNTSGALQHLHEAPVRRDDDREGAPHVDRAAPRTRGPLPVTGETR